MYKILIWVLTLSIEPKLCGFFFTVLFWPKNSCFQLQRPQIDLQKMKWRTGQFIESWHQFIESKQLPHLEFFNSQHFYIFQCYIIVVGSSSSSSNSMLYTFVSGFHLLFSSMCTLLIFTAIKLAFIQLNRAEHTHTPLRDLKLPQLLKNNEMLPYCFLFLPFSMQMSNLCKLTCRNLLLCFHPFTV